MTQFFQMLSVAGTYRTHPPMIQPLLTIRLTGQFLAVPACSLGRHLQGMGPGDVGKTDRITGDPISQNAVRCRDVPGAFFDNPAAFGPKAHRSILDRAGMFPRTSVAWHGPWGLRGDPENLR